jgi:hypothetical protein
MLFDSTVRFSSSSAMMSIDKVLSTSQARLDVRFLSWAGLGRSLKCGGKSAQATEEATYCQGTNRSKHLPTRSFVHIHQRLRLSRFSHGEVGRVLNKYL